MDLGEGIFKGVCLNLLTSRSRHLSGAWAEATKKILIYRLLLAIFVFFLLLISLDLALQKDNLFLICQYK